MNQFSFSTKQNNSCKEIRAVLPKFDLKIIRIRVDVFTKHQLITSTKKGNKYSLQENFSVKEYRNKIPKRKQWMNT